MNIVNRIIMIVLIPIVGIAITLLAISPNGFWVQLIGFVKTYETVRINEEIQWRLVYLAVAMFIDLVLLLFWLFEIRRPPQHMIRVRRENGGEIRLPIESIAERLAYHIDQVHEVIDVRPKVSAKSGGVAVHLYVTTGPDVDVPTKADEIINVARWVIKEKLGLQLAGDPKVELRVAPYPQTSRVESTPQPPMAR